MMIAEFKYFVACLISKNFVSEDRKIWLISENGSNYARDNGVAFFEYLQDHNFKDVYYIASKSNKDIDRLKKYKGKIIAKESFRHLIYSVAAEYFIVSHGIGDVCPSILMRKYKHAIRPIVYLQHGVVGYKKIFYSKTSYEKNIIRFISSNDSERDILVGKMMSRATFNKYSFLRWKYKSSCILEDLIAQGVAAIEGDVGRHVQGRQYTEKLAAELATVSRQIGLPSARVPVTGLARYDDLIRKSVVTAIKKQILIFPTWRDWIRNDDDFIKSDFFLHYKKLLSHDGFRELLRRSSTSVKFYIHSNSQDYTRHFECCANENIEIISDAASIQELVLESSLIITDYSSLSWDFNYLNKKVIFFHFDAGVYEKERGSYINSAQDWKGFVCGAVDDVFNCIAQDVDSRNVLFPPSSCFKYVDDGNCERILSEINSIPKRVFFVVYNIYGIGGTVRTTINFANYLYEKGYDVEIISIKRTHGSPSLNLDPGIKITAILDLRKNFAAYKGADSLLRRMKNFIVRKFFMIPSIFIPRGDDLRGMHSLYTDIQLLRILRRIRNAHVISTRPGYTAILAGCKLVGVKKIAQEHQTFESRAELNRKLRSRYGKVDVLTVLTQRDKAKFQESDIRANIEVLPNGVEIPERASNCETKKIVTLARLSEEKRIDLLIQAFSGFVQEVEGWTLEIYGAGPLHSELQMLIESLGLKDRVVLRGSTTNVNAVLQDAGIFAMTSEFEGFGMSLLEAMANGLPVISFAVPNGPLEIVRHEVDGFLIRPFDLAEYTAHLVELASDVDLRRSMGKHGRCRASETYSIDAAGKILEALLV